MTATDQKDVTELRRELDQIDQSMIQLLAERLRLVEQVRSAKLREKKALFDRDREREVRARAFQNATKFGLNQDYARKFVDLMLEFSYQIQEGLISDAEQIAKADQSVSILIIGGRGKMGDLFAKALSMRGHSLSVIDKADAIASDQIQAADLVIISVPMELASSVTAQVAPMMRKDALLCDLNSLKEEVCREMQQANSEALGMHPMFGPSVRSFRRQKIIICPVKSGPRLEWWLGELGKLGFELIEANPTEHDQMMGIVQVLTHLGTMVMGEALMSTGIDIDKTLSFTSPIYRLEMAMIGRLFAQSPELYAEIALENPHAERIREIYIKATTKLVALLKSSDRAQFRREFLNIRNHFKAFSGEALKLSDRIIETITKEI